MEFERLFSAANMLVLPGWLLLIVLPRWRYTAGFITSVLLPGVLGIAYAILIARALSSGVADLSGFGSLASVRAMFGDDGVMLAAWIHYLAFDLFVGSWEVRDARKVGVPHLLVVPCLFFTFMLGPVGLLMYLVLRLVARGRWMVGEPAEIANGGNAKVGHANAAG